MNLSNDMHDIPQTDIQVKGKLYRFHQLSEESKKRAAHEVYEKEIYREHDYSHEVEHIQEYLVELIREEGLDVTDKGVSWEDNYGITLHLGDVKMNEAYIKKVLSKEDFELYEALEEISKEYMDSNLFDEDEDGFILTFDSPFNNIEQEVMEFIINYTDDEDIKAKYKLAILFCDDDGEMDTDEGIEDLHADLINLGNSIANDLSIKISKPLEKLHDNLYKVVRDHNDYLESEQYFYDLLEGEGYLFEKYLFNLDGDIIVEDDVFLDDDNEELYEPYKEETL